MSRMSFHLYCQRVDASRNMARYYMLAIQPTLFGETAVVRRWNLIVLAGGATGAYALKFQEAFALDTRLHPPSA